MLPDHLFVGLVVALDLEAERVWLNQDELLTLKDATGALRLTGEDTDTIALLAKVEDVINDRAEKDGAIRPLVTALNVSPFVNDILRVVVNEHYSTLVAIHEESCRSKKLARIFVVGKVATHRHIERINKNYTWLGGHLVDGADQRLEILLNVQRQKFLGQMSKARVVEWQGRRHAVHSVYEVGAFPLGLDVENIYRAWHGV